MADSQVTIVGALGKDPELRFTPSGRGVTSFTVAVSNRYKPANSDEWVDDTAWVDCSAWGTLGENFAASCEKGTRVIVVGKLRQEEWDDKETGKKRTKLSLTADSCGPDLRWAQAVIQKTERTGGKEGPFDG